MKKTLVTLAILATLSSVACTRISTGHVGIRTDFSGQVEPQELGTGWHQTLFGTIHTYVANEITQNLLNLTPQTKDKSKLSDLDLTYTYSVNPSAIADFSVKYKGRDAIDDNGDYLPLARYVDNVMNTAVTDVISKYNALDANNNRELIKEDIKTTAKKMFDADGLNGSVQIHQVFIKNLNISNELTASASRVITAQNELAAKTFEVQTAAQEASRLSLLSANGKNIDFMQAKALSDIAEGIKNGKVNTIVVPWDFKGIVQTSSK